MIYLARETIVMCIVLGGFLLIPQAHAFPCSGGSGKEYCKGYHSGAVAADKDNDAMANPGNTKGLDVDNHPCHKSADFCSGFNKGYNDEASILA